VAGQAQFTRRPLPTMRAIRARVKIVGRNGPARARDCTSHPRIRFWVGGAGAVPWQDQSVFIVDLKFCMPGSDHD
jgi:hypothetical protein